MSDWNALISDSNALISDYLDACLLFVLFVLGWFFKKNLIIK